MSWKKAEDAAREWAQDNGAGFVVTAADKEARSISFRAPCGSFYVTVPEKTGSEEWVCLFQRQQTCSSVSSLRLDGVE